MALHHGSLDRKTREWVEDGLRDGKLRCVVCTSTLDLGVDFTPVDRVLQVGSPKAVGRLIQRAGRSGHQPGAVSRLTCVPTNALELVDVAAARDALEAGRDRGPPAGGAAARSAGAARGHRRPRRRLPARRALRRGAHHPRLPRSHARRVGAGCSTSSPTAATRCAPIPNTARSWWRMDATWSRSRMAAMRHRLSIGTIVSESSMKVQFLRGRTLGSVEENFIARLRPGDRFTFAGRTLEFVRARGHRGLRAEVHPEDVRRAALVRRPAADLAGAGRRHPGQARRGAAGHLRRARDDRRASDPRAAGPLVPASRHRRAADRAGRDPRGPSPLLLSGRGAARARRDWPRSSPIGSRSSARSRSPSPPTTTGSSCCRPMPRRSTRRSRPASSRPSICCTTSPRASTPPSWPGGSSARSRGWRGSSSRDIRA